MSVALRQHAKGQKDTELTIKELEGLLSPFQVEKLRYFFEHFLDHDKNGIVNVSRNMNRSGDLVAGR